MVEMPLAGAKVVEVAQLMSKGETPEGREPYSRSSVHYSHDGPKHANLDNDHQTEPYSRRHLTAPKSPHAEDNGNSRAVDDGKKLLGRKRIYEAVRLSQMYCPYAA